MKFQFFSAMILAASLANAAPAKVKKNVKQPSAPAPTLREQALSESALSAKTSKSNTATDAQVNSAYLRLQDPRPQIVTRTFKYNFGIQLTRWTPTGTTVLPVGSNYDLSTSGATAMPVASIGFQRELIYNAEYTADWGLSFQAGYASQPVEFTLPSGYEVSGNRLNTTMIKAQIPVQFKLASLKDFSSTLTPQIGALNYTQSGVDPLANFSKQTTFTSLGLALAYHLDENLAVNVETIANSDLGKQNVKIQPSQINIGTQVLW